MCDSVPRLAGNHHGCDRHRAPALVALLDEDARNHEKRTRNHEAQDMQRSLRLSACGTLGSVERLMKGHRFHHTGSFGWTQLALQVFSGSVLRLRESFPAAFAGM